MGELTPSRKQVLNAIRELAATLGHRPSRRAFVARSGLSESHVWRYFDSWNDAVRAAGFKPHVVNVKLDDNELLQSWGELVRLRRRIPSYRTYMREGSRYSPDAYARRWGWSGVPDAFRRFAQGKPEWADVLALLPAESFNAPRASGRGPSPERAGTSAFERALQTEAHEAAGYYATFYRIERTLRQVVSDRLRQVYGRGWWHRVPYEVQAKVRGRMLKEQDAGVSPRSQRNIDFTTFRELAEVIDANGSYFQTSFTGLKALKRTMAVLSALRNPITHYCPLPDDEATRLGIAVSDWNRIVRSGTHGRTSR